MTAKKEVHAIFGLVRYFPLIPQFLHDLEDRLATLRAAFVQLISAESEVHPIRESNLDHQAKSVDLSRAISRNLHTLKGTCASFGFESLSQLAGEMEMRFEELKALGPAPEVRSWGGITDFLDRMDSANREILALYRSLLEPEALGKPERIVDVGDTYSLDRLAEKYRDLVHGLAQDLGKRVEFLVKPEGMEIALSVFTALDEPLIHLLRNAIDHGIETEGVRLLSGKPGIGRIELGIVETSETLDVSVSDDGEGIDGEALASRALALGWVSQEVLNAADSGVKANLIFIPGLSSRMQAGLISGRGVGMDAVAHWAGLKGGTVGVNTRRGEGTTITLRVPKSAAEQLQVKDRDGSRIEQRVESIQDTAMTGNDMG